MLYFFTTNIIYQSVYLSNNITNNFLINNKYTNFSSVGKYSLSSCRRLRSNLLFSEWSLSEHSTWLCLFPCRVGFGVCVHSACLLFCCGTYFASQYSEHSYELLPCKVCCRESGAFQKLSGAKLMRSTTWRQIPCWQYKRLSGAGHLKTLKSGHYHPNFTLLFLSTEKCNIISIFLTLILWSFSAN